MDLFGMMMSGRMSCGGRLRMVARSGPKSWADSIELVALGANTLEDLAASVRVAVHLQCGFVPLKHCLTLARAFFKQGARTFAQRRVATHEQLALVSKSQRPRLNDTVLDRRQQQSRTVGIEEHRIGGFGADGRRHRAQWAMKKAPTSPPLTVPRARAAAVWTASGCL